MASAALWEGATPDRRAGSPLVRREDSDTVVPWAVPEPPAPPSETVSYTHLRAHETREDLVCRLLHRRRAPLNR